jgi:hypothetical protein
MRPGAIGKGDVARALAKLAPQNDQTRSAIVRALGYELDALTQPTAAKAKPPDRPSGSPKARETKLDSGVAIEQGSGASLLERHFKLHREKGKASGGPGWLIVPQAAIPLPSAVPEDELPRPVLEPLLNPQWSRAVVSTMARIRLSAGPPIIEKLVELAAEKKLLSEAPAAILETASGADVLVDVGESMLVFGRDQERLVEAMRRVLGSSQVAVFRFFGSPKRGVLSGTDSECLPYRPPRPGWPVLVLTDLNIGAGGPPVHWWEWRDFAESVRSAGCRVLALVPYPPARWPANVARAMHVIQWDRGTSVQTVRAAIGPAGASSR